MPQEKQANEARYFFVCGSENFHVETFRVEDSVSAVYDAVLSLRCSNRDIALDDITGKPATFFMYRDGQHYPYSGIVWDFRYCGGDATGTSVYSATLKPRICKLGLQRQTRIFQKLSYADIIKEVIEKAGLRGYCTMELSRELPVREYVTQYQESDFAFISRLMEAAGLWYFFREPPLGPSQPKAGATSEKLVITDKPAAFRAIDGDAKLPFRDARGMVERDETGERESVAEVHSRLTATPREVLVKDYNYRTPDVRVEGTEEVKNGLEGLVYEYGGAFKNVMEAEDAAKVAANRIGAWRTVVDGVANCPRFRAGRRFILSEHHRGDLNAEYVLASVSHGGGHDGGVPTYDNTFEALPASSVTAFSPVKKTENPRVNGVMTAFVEAGGGMYASIDDMARYKARMSFDISDAKNSEASEYLRLMQPYAGAKYGMHFPAHEGTEMIWACIGGDPDKPIGLGMVPNADTPSPVVSANKAQNIIRTAGGNELLMDDTDKKQKIHLLTAAKNVFEADDGEKRAFIQTPAQNQVLLDDKNERVSITANKHSVVMSYKGGEEGIVISTAGGHVIKIDDKNKSITIQSKAGNAVQMDDGAKSIVMKDAGGKNSVTLDGKGLVLDSKEKILISAKKDIEIKGANIKITANANMNAKAGKDLVMNGTKIEAKASAKMSLEGSLGVEVKSNANTKISGLKTDLSATGIASISGKMVKIN